jgi:putative FmdB family regulatory protein
MPFYEYECASCKSVSEVMQKISEAPLKKCPVCGKSTLKKLISAPVFRLKGGGWYETDFKSDKENKRNLAGDGSDGGDSKAPAADSKPTETKTESKPESKPEPKPVEKASSSASKSVKPAAKAPARKSPAKPKAKAKAGKRRGR